MGKHRIVCARSGVQYYLQNELPGLGLNSVPAEFSGLSVFGVYRPADVLRRALPLIAGAPVVDGHEKRVFTGSEPYILGHCGTSPSVKAHKGELVVTSDFDISQEDKMPAYRELSLGYVGDNRWAPGITKDGVPYQIMCDGIRSVEHLAFVPKARGGADMRVLDSGVKLAKKLANGLRSVVYKSKGLVCDEATSWEQLIDQLRSVEGLVDSDVEVYANGLLSCLDDVQDGENKDLLLRYVADLPVLADEPQDIWLSAVDTIDNLYKQSIGGAMHDNINSNNVPAQTSAEQAAPQMSSADTGAIAALQVSVNTLIGVVDKLANALAGTQAKTEEQKSEEQKSEEQKSEEQKSEEQKSEEQKSEEQKSEEQKPEADGSQTTPPSGDAVTKDGAEVVVVTASDVKAENDAVETTEVPQAAGGDAAEEAMTPDGVVSTDNGQLRNQVEAPAEEPHKTCEQCGNDPCTCKQATDGQAAQTVVNVNIPPFTGDALPAINMQAPSVGAAGSPLDDWFSHMKSRR